MIVINESNKYPFKNHVWSSYSRMNSDLINEGYEVLEIDNDKIKISKNDNSSIRIIESYNISRINGSISFEGNGPRLIN